MMGILKLKDLGIEEWHGLIDSLDLDNIRLHVKSPNRIFVRKKNASLKDIGEGVLVWGDSGSRYDNIKDALEDIFYERLNQ